MLFFRRQWYRAVGRREADPWFCLPVALAMLLDAAVSLACQPTEYWSRPTAVDEANSTWGRLLALGPAAFVLGFVVYVALMVFLLWWLSGGLQKFVGVFVLLAHGYGAASWCQVKLPAPVYWWALMGLFLLEAAAFAAYWRLREQRLSRLPARRPGG